MTEYATAEPVNDTAAMLSFQKLDVYQRSIEFPHIAEGAGKTGRADKARYYALARGSAMESTS